jgi:hypothetical protein
MLEVLIGTLVSRTVCETRQCLQSDLLVERMLQFKRLLKSMRVKQRNAFAQIVAREARVNQVYELERKLLAILLLGVA